MNIPNFKYHIEKTIHVSTVNYTNKGIDIGDLINAAEQTVGVSSVRETRVCGGLIITLQYAYQNLERLVAENIEMSWIKLFQEKVGNMK